MDQPSEAAAQPPAVWDRPLVSVPILAFLSLVGGQLPSFSLSANLYTLALGGALIWLGLSNRMPRRPVARGFWPGAAWWLLPVAVFGGFEAGTFLLGSKPDYPTFSLLADPILESESVRSAVYFGWLAAFWALVRR
jgi:hypothetical protein